MGRHTGPGTAAPNKVGAPTYVRALRLKHLHLGALACFVLFEASVGVTVLVALAGYVNWVAVPIVPLTVAAMVKLNDVVVGRLDAFALPPARRRGAARRPEVVTGRASVLPLPTTVTRTPAQTTRPAQRPPATRAPLLPSGRCAVSPISPGRDKRPGRPVERLAASARSEEHTTVEHLPAVTPLRPADDAADGWQPGSALGSGRATGRSGATPQARRGARSASVWGSHDGAELPAEATGEDLVVFLSQMRQREESDAPRELPGLAAFADGGETACPPGDSDGLRRPGAERGRPR